MLKNRIKALRSSKKWTQAELAKKLNVSQQTIGSWEVGRAEPNSEALISLAKLFGVSTDYLLNGTESKSDPNLLIATHVDDDLTEKQKQEVLDFIEFIKMRDHNKK